METPRKLGRLVVRFPATSTPPALTPGWAEMALGSPERAHVWDLSQRVNSRPAEVTSDGPNPPPAL